MQTVFWVLFKRCWANKGKICTFILKTSALILVSFFFFLSCHCTNSLFFFFHRLFTRPLKQSGGGERGEYSGAQKLCTHNSVGRCLAAQGINMSASFSGPGRPAYFPNFFGKSISDSSLYVCVSVCVRVLWTHCLAKSLWGSLSRLCFPSGESIQVTDTESWPQSKWPLKSWKCFLTWHLTISDVAVGYERRSDLELSAAFSSAPSWEAGKVSRET